MAGGHVRAVVTCQRKHGEKVFGRSSAFEHNTHQAICQTNGTARQSLALDNLQETEKLPGPERDRAEKVVAGALASMYAGE